MVRSRDAAIEEEEWNWFLRGSAVAAITDRLENEEDLDRGSLPSYRAGGNGKRLNTVTDLHARTRLTSNIVQIFLFRPGVFQISFSVPSLFIFHRDRRHWLTPF